MVFFMVRAKTSVTGFQVTNDGEKFVTVRESRLRSFNGVDSGELHMCIGHVMIESDDVRTELIR